MKIIKPSATIIEKELEGMSVYQRIDHCASVCYQRPPKPTDEEAKEFCAGMVKRGHFATMEMAQVHLVLPIEYATGFRGEKYIVVSAISGGTEAVVSGSIRAFMESDNASAGHLSKFFLQHEFPAFFGPAGCSKSEHVRFAEHHEIPWEHQYVAVRFIVNRAVSHELVRHRPCSFLQESQRYCRYGDEVVFIEPEWWDKSNCSAIASAECDWESHMNTCECRYKELLSRGLKPQQARAVLPNSTKTELIVYASLPEWKHIFSLRCAPAADPEMRRVMIPLMEDFKSGYPDVEW